MNRFFRIFSSLLIISIINFSQNNDVFAQAIHSSAKKFDQIKFNTYQKSSSLKSSANDFEYFNPKIKKQNNNIEEKTFRKDVDSYTRRDKTTREDKNSFSENYFHIDKSKNSLWDGKHWTESNFPLKIFIKESSSRFYKTDYKDYVKYAMDVWRKADDRIQYKFVKSISEADIAVMFVENLGDKYEENYLGLTDYDSNKNKQIEFSKIQISLIKNGNEKISAGEIKATIVHEFGHALGLGHSDNEKDLMYPYISPNHTAEMTYKELSEGDKLAIKDAINLSFDEKYVLK
jgi:predicted Zn-dependent protease